MALHIFRLEDVGSFHDTRANGEESSSKFLVREIFDDFGGVWSRSVIERETPGHLVGAGDDILDTLGGVSASTTGPPATGGIGGGGRVTLARTILGRGEIEERLREASDFGHPLLDLRGVARRRSVFGGISRRVKSQRREYRSSANWGSDTCSVGGLKSR